MIKRLVPLALLAAWIPQAQAFPPCPVDPMDYGSPLGEVAASGIAASADDDAEPWFKADYRFVGDPIVIGQIAPERAIEPAVDPHTGKCRDRDGLPVMNSHTSSGVLQLDPDYAPNSGFGVIDLPYLPEVATDGLQVEYRLRFTVDNDLLQAPTDWLDVVQLDFFRNGSAGAKYPQAVSSIYRVRKVRRNSVASIEVIESRVASPSIVIRPRDQVVAVIPLPGHQRETAMSLRWTQTATPPIDNGTGQDSYDIHVVFEVLGPIDEVLYTTQLPRQWASLLSMGLLDYNVADASEYEKNDAMEFSNVTLSATRRD